MRHQQGLTGRLGDWMGLGDPAGEILREVWEELVNKWNERKWNEYNEWNPRNERIPFSIIQLWRVMMFAPPPATSCAKSRPSSACLAVPVSTEAWFPSLSPNKNCLLSDLKSMVPSGND